MLTEKTCLGSTDKRILTKQMYNLYEIVQEFNRISHTTKIDEHRLIKMFLSDEWLKFSRVKVNLHIREQLHAESENVYVFIVYNNVEDAQFYRALNMLRDKPHLNVYFDININNQKRIFPQNEYYFFYPTDIISKLVTFTPKESLHIFEICICVCEEALRSQKEAWDWPDIDLSRILNTGLPIFNEFLIHIPFIRMYCVKRNKVIDDNTSFLYLMCIIFLRVMMQALQNNEDAGSLYSRDVYSMLMGIGNNIPWFGHYQYECKNSLVEVINILKQREAEYITFKAEQAEQEEQDVTEETVEEVTKNDT